MKTELIPFLSFFYHTYIVDEEEKQGPTPTQAQEKFLTGLAVLGAPWQSRSDINLKVTLF